MLLARFVFQISLAASTNAARGQSSPRLAPAVVAALATSVVAALAAAAAAAAIATAALAAAAAALARTAGHDVREEVGKRG